MARAQLYSPQPITKALLKAVAKASPPDAPKEIRDKDAGILVRHLPTGNAVLYATLGRGKREKLGRVRDVLDETHKLTLTAVKIQARILRGEDAGGRDFKGERAAERRIPTLSEYLDKEQEASYGWHLVHNRKTGEAILARLKACFEESFASKKLSEITPDLVDAWRTRRRRAVIPETINRDVGALKSALNQAVKWQKIAESPLARLEPLKVDRHKRSIRALTGEEVQALRDALKDREDRIRKERASGNSWREERGYTLLPSLEGVFVDALRPAVELSLETGMRRGELLAMTWEHVDLKARVIHLPGETTKSHTTREIPLNSRALSILRAWRMQHGRPDHGYVFPGGEGHIRNLKRSFNAAVVAAGIKRSTAKGRATWHSLRHTFGTRLGAAGVDAETLRQLMGHADLTTTQRYLDSDEQRRHAAVEKLEQL